MCWMVVKATLAASACWPSVWCTVDSTLAAHCGVTVNPCSHHGAVNPAPTDTPYPPLSKPCIIKHRLHTMSVIEDMYMRWHFEVTMSTVDSLALNIPLIVFYLGCPTFELRHLMKIIKYTFCCASIKDTIRNLFRGII